MFGFIYILDMIFSSILLLTKKISVKWKAILIGVIFGTLGLMMTPRNGNFSDVVRFFNELNSFRLEISLSSFSDVFNYLIHSSTGGTANDAVAQYSSVPVMGVVMMIMSYLKNGWLLFLTAFIDISSASYLVISSTHKYLHYQVENYDVRAWLIFSCLFNFNATIGGIRNGVIGCIFILVFWSILDENKESIFIKLTILTLVLSLVHPFTLVIYLLAIIAIFCYKHNYLMFIFEIILLCQHFYQPILLNHLNSLGGGAFLESLSFKSTQYFGSSAYIGAASQFSIVRDTMRVFLFICIIFFVRYNSKTTNYYQKYNAFTDLFISLSIGAYTDQIFFSRCSLIMTIVLIPYLVRLIYIFNNNTNKLLPVLSKYLFNFLLLISLVDNLRAGTRFFSLTLNNII